MKLCLVVPLALAACSSAPKNFQQQPPGDGDSGATVPDPCANGYPTGGYGTSMGKVVNPGLGWQGYAAKETSPSTIHPADLYDCDGSKGINALVFDVSAVWCAACQAQAADTAQISAQYDALGIRLITLMVQDASQAPATVQTALQWRQQYQLNDVAVCADPGFAFAPLGQSSVDLPVTVVVDPRTMIIQSVSYGYMAHYPLAPDGEAVTIAKKNGAP